MQEEDKGWIITNNNIKSINYVQKKGIGIKYSFPHFIQQITTAKEEKIKALEFEWHIKVECFQQHSFSFHFFGVVSTFNIFYFIDDLLFCTTNTFNEHTLFLPY